MLMRIMAVCVWVSTLSSQQRWRGPSGRYSTDWNAAAYRHCSLVADMQPDTLLGVILCRPSFVYDELTVLDAGTRTQTRFWQCIFGEHLEGHL